jgi:hypothetical protein
MELDLQSLVGLHVHSCMFSLAETPQPTPPPALGLIYEGAIGQPRQTTSLCDALVTDMEYSVRDNGFSSITTLFCVRVNN